MFAEARCKPWRGEADRVAQPPPWRFQTPLRRSDQCASITRLPSGQRAIRSAGIASSARALPHCGLDTAEPHIRSPLIAAGTKIPHFEVIGLERAEPIFITASCSQDVMRFARRDPA